jgi:hypothetical protein
MQRDDAFSYFGEGTMQKWVVVETAAALLLAGAAQAAEPVTYMWTGPGDVAGWVNPKQGDRRIGSEECARHMRTIYVTVTGSTVKIRLGERQLITTLGQDGVFKTDFSIPHTPVLNHPEKGTTRAGLDDDMVHITGLIKQDGSYVQLEAHCHWGGKLTRK